MWTTIAVSDLATYLKRELAQRSWSQREAARRLGLSVSTLNDILNKPNKEPEHSTLRRIAEGLEMPLRRVFELAGVALEDTVEDEAALYGLSDDQRKFLRSLPPEKKAALIEMARRMLGES